LGLPRALEAALGLRRLLMPPGRAGERHVEVQADPERLGGLGEAVVAVPVALGVGAWVVRAQAAEALVAPLRRARLLGHDAPQHRGLALADRVVLVGRARDRQAAAVDDQPRPAGAELADTRGLELLLELVERAERVVDRARQVTVGLAAAVRAHRLPERRVVQ